MARTKHVKVFDAQLARWCAENGGQGNRFRRQPATGKSQRLRSPCSFGTVATGRRIAAKRCEGGMSDVIDKEIAAITTAHAYG